MTNDTYFTPPMLAKLWSVSSAKVRRWIESGELVASNLSDGERPRYKISCTDAAKFWNGRLARRQKALSRRSKILTGVETFV